MAINKNTQTNIDNSDPTNYPDAQIKDDDGSNNGTPVARETFSDMFEVFAKLMRMASIAYNNDYDNENNGYQYVQALQALAGKNDLLLNLGSASGKLTLPLKLETLQEGEILIARATVGFDSETQFSGLSATVKNINGSSPFVINDRLMLIHTSSGIQIVTLAMSDNLNSLVTALLFVKAATETDEYAGLSTTTATTPYTNQLAFARRVIGLDSGMFLATQLRNGLLSKEDKTALDNLVDPVKNRGSISGVDPGGTGGFSSYPVTGDIVSATVFSVGAGGGTGGAIGSTTLLITFANSMVGTNYLVRAYIQSLGTLEIDNDVACPIFRPISATQCYVGITDVGNGTQSVKIHLEVVQL